MKLRPGQEVSSIEQLRNAVANHRDDLEVSFDGRKTWGCPTLTEYEILMTDHAYRIKPPPPTKSFTKDDVLPGSIIRHNQVKASILVTEITYLGVEIRHDNKFSIVSYERLSNEFEIRATDGTWSPCNKNSKEKDNN